MMKQGHFWLSAACCILLLPAAFAARLRIVPSSSDLTLLGGWAILSIFWAALLYQFAIPGAWSAYRGSAVRLLFILPLYIAMAFVYGPLVGIEAAVAVFAIGEFHFRRCNWKNAAGALLPWFYLVAGIKIAAFFSSVIVTLRACTESDSALNRLDSLLLMGGSVDGFSRAASALYLPAEFVYYCMFGAMGAGILFLCLAGDRRAAFQMSGAILTAYYLSLILFYFFPAQGPFIFAPLQARLLTAAMQGNSLANATALYHHTSWIAPPAAYYVAFPSLHIAQPLIAAWFLRRWRAVSVIVFGYCLLLTPSILILRWHYVVDIIGGLVVAALAIAFVSVTPGSVQSQTPHGLKT